MTQWQSNQGRVITRRAILDQGVAGLGRLALASLLGESVARASEDPLARAPSQTPDHPPRAKHVIFLHMVGAPSQLDLFDPKPELSKHHAELLPEHLWQGLQLAFIRERPRLFASPFRFRQCGQSGIELSELLPHLSGVADELTLVRSLHSEQINHAPAQLFMQTGSARFGRPCIGSWTSYGLGSENEDLPAFVVMNTGSIAGAGNSLWGSGFLPTVHQGVEFRGQGDPVLFLSNPDGVNAQQRKRIVDTVNHLNRLQEGEFLDPEIETRIQQYELAYRMQTSVPELADLSDEPAWVHKAYGTSPGKSSFANNCLLARRLVERGVRFVQLYDQGWDTHGNLVRGLPNKCRQVDQPIAALISDLKQRGLLEETLVVFASEFGRTPMVQGELNQAAGRDHHRHAFSCWMAGGGVARGRVVGKTDPLGFDIVENPVHVNDFHATLLHLLGIHHERLTYRYQGRRFRLTDVAGRVVEPILA